ncbi:haloacid dehalogenase-like hydrolase [Lampropedia puyangensis]|uniref:phosphoserine phosphatase n=1 Tax=Lampropedia puyangensis TaxID=1330072 RepID=A0A4S8FBU1_9BURK|nr:haloacid dehalogenase-like hydrolase [Lampropedia puyangensis]THU05128.1 haloacid dehalogenase-like hydrolase [Lampropedia puyangensis]
MDRRFFLSATAASLLVAGCASGRLRTGAAVALPTGNWDAFNHAQLSQMIQAMGNTSRDYRADRPPYAVFDWDNTSIFLDIQEALLVYQLQQLAFGMTPAQMDTAVRMNIPQTPFAAEFKNAQGQPLGIDAIAKDIVASYTWLHSHYAGLAGNQSLEQVQRSPHYGAFIAKVRYLYEAIGGTFDHATSYPWVTYLLTGLTQQQVRQLTADTVRWQLTQPIEKVTWNSPQALPGEAGVVSVSWKNGLRLAPEMQSLYQTLRGAGWDVWVCSASFVDVIKEISSNPEFGYNNPAERVLAMELERDADGRIQTQFRQGYDQTQGPGKTATIRRFLVSHYGYGPALIAGDSEGDQNMLVDFPELKHGLIVNRLRDPSTMIGQLSAKAASQYGHADAVYLLQGRDDNRGELIPSQQAIQLGKRQAQTLK